MKDIKIKPVYLFVLFFGFLSLLAGVSNIKYITNIVYIKVAEERGINTIFGLKYFSPLIPFLSYIISGLFAIVGGSIGLVKIKLAKWLSIGSMVLFSLVQIYFSGGMIWAGLSIIVAFILLIKEE